MAGMARIGIFGRFLVVLKRLDGLLSAIVMHGQLGCKFTQACPVCLLDMSGDFPVVVCAQFLRKQLIADGLIERMRKSVSGLVF